MMVAPQLVTKAAVGAGIVMSIVMTLANVGILFTYTSSRFSSVDG
jgi:hypothetical protein